MLAAVVVAAAMELVALAVQVAEQQDFLVAMLAHQ